MVFWVFSCSPDRGAVNVFEVDQGQEEDQDGFERPDHVEEEAQKGTYTLTVDVTAAGNANYNAVTKTVKVRVKVK